MNILYMTFKMRRLVVFTTANCASVILLSSMIQHVHLKVGFVDETFVANRALHFDFWLMIADCVEFQWSLCLEVLTTCCTTVRFISWMCVLWINVRYEQNEWDIGWIYLQYASEDSRTLRMLGCRCDTRKVFHQNAIDCEVSIDNDF